MRRSLVLVITGLVLLAACGSSGSDAATTSTTKPPGTAADRRLAQVAQLDATIAPGFQQVATQSSELADLPQAAASTPACKFFIADGSTRIMTVRSVGLQRGTNVVDSSVAVYPDAAAAQTEFERFQDPAMIECLKVLYGNVDVSPIAPNDLGDDRIGFRITPTGQPDAAKSIDIVVVRIGRVLLSLNITGTAAESAEIQSTVVPEAIDRMRAAGA